MIQLMKGNLLEDSAEAYVNTVNTVGVMGKGIAFQFKQAFPDVFKQYAKDCKKGLVQVGKMHVVEVHGLAAPQYVINFPTKEHWRHPSRLEYIQKGLIDLVEVVQDLDIKSIALPPLGCGNGGLDWRVVRSMIVEAFQPLNIEVHLYEPAGAPPLDKMIVRTKNPKMTIGRALLLAAMSRYAGPGYRMSLLEVQKIAYFLYEIGALPNLKYEKGKFGPYADNLNHVLQTMEGHYIRGYGDRTQNAEIYLINNAEEAAEKFLSTNDKANHYLQRVADLIYGFETPYDLELLSSVGWILKEEPTKVEDKHFIVESVMNWNERKKKIFPVDHITQVWDYLVHEMNFT